MVVKLAETPVTGVSFEYSILLEFDEYTDLLQKADYLSFCKDRSLATEDLGKIIINQAQKSSPQSTYSEIVLAETSDKSKIEILLQVKKPNKGESTFIELFDLQHFTDKKNGLNKSLKKQLSTYKNHLKVLNDYQSVMENSEATTDSSRSRFPYPEN